MNNAPYFEKAVRFIHQIGIKTESRAVTPGQSFVPGLSIEQGRIIIDPEQLRYPGDILHEAGHIAVVPLADRDLLNGPDIEKRADAPAEEMMAIAWSYAACIYLDIDAAFVFHKEGYRGSGPSIMENFRAGRYFGVPMLQWLGMTTTSGSAEAVYPAMIRWTRD
jgi:hypothetical protein